MKTLQEIKTHLRSYSVDVRTENREKFGEVFTPTDLVNQILDQMDPNVFIENNTFLDHCCGNGQFLSEVLIRKLENNIPFEQALSEIYGVEINKENVNGCKERLLCGQEHLQHIVDKNIVCADASRYHYRFDESYPYDDEQKEIIFESLFEID